MNATTSAPLLLDLFCGAGGAGTGYARAGWRVVGCDLDPRPLRHNPHECYQGDALAVLDTLLAGETWQGYRLAAIAAIHASPPCQHDSLISRNFGYSARHVRMLEPVRTRLRATGLPYIMENVEGAPLDNAVMLCGSTFALGIPEHGWYLRRHRLFESNAWLFAAGPCRHRGMAVSVVGHGTTKYIRDRCGRCVGVAEVRRLMGIDWMTRAELSQAIPPAYTAWLGAQLLRAVEGQGAA